MESRSDGRNRSTRGTSTISAQSVADGGGTTGCTVA
jgi:hypothetical protein